MREENVTFDPECARCGAEIVDEGSTIEREGQTYCCVNCARADDPEILARVGASGRACSRCGAPIHDRGHAVVEATYVFCCRNCSAAGVNAEPAPEG